MFHNKCLLLSLLHHLHLHKHQHHPLLQQRLQPLPKQLRNKLQVQLLQQLLQIPPKQHKLKLKKQLKQRLRLPIHQPLLGQVLLQAPQQHQTLIRILNCLQLNQSQVHNLQQKVKQVLPLRRLSRELYRPAVKHPSLRSNRSCFRHLTANLGSFLSQGMLK